MSVSARPRVQVKSDKKSINYMAGQLEGKTEEEIKIIVKEILNLALEMTLDDLDKWIDIKVPERTGQLRDNLHRQIRSSRVTNRGLRLIMGTNIDYASYVNAMTTRQVRHNNVKAYAYYYGHYGRIILNDSKAIGHYHDEMVKFGKKRLNDNLATAKQKTIGKYTLQAMKRAEGEKKTKKDIPTLLDLINVYNRSASRVFGRLKRLSIIVDELVAQGFKRAAIISLLEREFNRERIDLQIGTGEGIPINGEPLHWISIL